MSLSRVLEAPQFLLERASYTRFSVSLRGAIVSRLRRKKSIELLLLMSHVASIIYELFGLNSLLNVEHSVPSTVHTWILNSLEDC